MKIEDLRIGNLVAVDEYYDNPQVLIGITSPDFNVYSRMDESDIVLKDSFDNHFYEINLFEGEEQRVFGIPLTEEWLLKFGIEYIDDNPKQKPHYEGDILFKILDFEFSNSMCDGFICYELNSKLIIKYVHQLQNLWYSLTAKELEVKSW